MAGDGSTDYNTQENNAELAAAYNEIFKSVRDLLTLKMTIPLGNPALKNVHTNQFLWYQMPKEFELANMETISKALNSAYNRYAPFSTNRWYIEGVTITNDGKKFQMDLELNPFASDMVNYRDELQSFRKAFIDTFTTTDESGNTIAPTKSTGNTSLKGGQGTTIDNLVKEICGNETDALTKCKLIHEWLRKEVKYTRYCCCKYPNAPEKAYNNRKNLNCGDTAILTCSMMKSAGLNAYIVHRTYNGGHFWTIIEINGKKYASDQTGNGSAFNTVWSNSGRANTSTTSYSHKENGLSCNCGYYAC